MHRPPADVANRSHVDGEVMLSLTRKTEYAIIGLSHLASVDRRCSAREISAASGVPLPVLMSVMKLLSKNGLLHGMRGVTGGYKLVAASADITLSDIVSAVDGGDPVRFVACADGGECPMGKGDTCTVRAGLEGTNRRMREVLENTSLADIVAGRSR